MEEQSLPLSASYLLPNLVNLTLLCSKLSVSPGHTVDSCSCPSGPASLFLQRCHLASCSQDGNPIQRARLPLCLPSHSPCWHILPHCLNLSEWEPCSPCSALFLPAWCHTWTCWGDILSHHRGHWWRCWTEQLQHQALRNSARHRLLAGHWYSEPEGLASFPQTLYSIHLAQNPQPDHNYAMWNQFLCVVAGRTVSTLLKAAPLLHTKVQTEMETINTCVTSWEFLPFPHITTTTYSFCPSFSYYIHRRDTSKAF